MKLLYFCAVLFLLAFNSCAGTGRFRPALGGEKIIGTVQVSFEARNLWLKKDEAVGMQAYIKLLEAAAQKFSGELDVKDIIWVTGRQLGDISTEIAATGKVIELKGR